MCAVENRLYPMRQYGVQTTNAHGVTVWGTDNKRTWRDSVGYRQQTHMAWQCGVQTTNTLSELYTARTCVTLLHISSSHSTLWLGDKKGITHKCHLLPMVLLRNKIKEVNRGGPADQFSCGKRPLNGGECCSGFNVTTTASIYLHSQSIVPTVWNSIPLSIRQSPSIGSFKRHLKTHLFTLPG